jgi:chromosome segregation ATPase
MNLENPTKWFLNMASKQKTIESPSNKLRKNEKKYENIKEVLTDVHGFYENIFSLRQRPDGVSIENFLGELKDKPEVLRKKLTEVEKEETNKKIEEKELKDALEKVSSGKTPGIDGIEREFLLRF